MIDRKTLSFFVVFFVLVVVTAAVVLYAQGYRINFEQKTLEGTGILLVKSSPDGAKIFIDGKPNGVTNTPISLKEGAYYLKLEKDGYFGWEKEVEVKSGLVTTADALLPLFVPELKPLTSSGVLVPALSNSQKDIAYALQNNDKSGIWVLPLESGGPIGILRSKTKPAVLDGTIKYSFAKSITWSPDDRQILVEIFNEARNESRYYLVDLSLPPTQAGQLITNKEVLLKDWEEEKQEARGKLVESLKLENGIKAYALAEDTLWSPDSTKFLYKKDGEYHLYNLTKPLGVGEKIDTTLPGSLAQDAIQWLADSRHLILLTGHPELGSGSTVSLIDMDGTNKRDLFSGNLMGDLAFSTPDASKIVVLTSFTPNSTPNLYTIGIR